MIKIMIADDNPAILDALKIMLSDEGYEVETTEDGATAKNIQQPFPDLLLLDLWMSGVDGGDICKYLKSKVETKGIPIIMISAAKNIKNIAKAAGADGYISKPFQMNDLLAVVAKHIYKRQIRK